MSKEEFTSLLEVLMMDNDLDVISYDTMCDFADKQAVIRGYIDWIDAYHHLIMYV